MKQISDRINVSYWFVPLVAGILAFVLARLLLWVDTFVPNLAFGTFGLYYSGSADAVRGSLVGMAATIMGTTGVVYSLLTVPMSVTSAQFGSRLLRVYLRDEVSHIVLGIFVGTFTYCLSLALSIPHTELEIQLPQISMTVAILLALAAFASMIALIHNIGILLQAPNLVAAASHELRDVIRSYTPLGKNRAPAPADPTEMRAMEAALFKKVEREGQPILAEGLGYIQNINPDMADLLADFPELVVQFVRKPGDFIHPGDLIARVWPPEISNAAVLRQVREAYRLGNSRSPVQDIKYGINQLVEVALRAMSPAINDPFTAMTCLDHLGAGIALFSENVPNKAAFYDTHNKLRIILDPVTYGELLDTAFNMLRHASQDNAEVLLCMLDNIAGLSAKVAQPEHRLELARQVRLIEMESQAGDCIEWDKARVSRRCAELLAGLETDKSD